MIFFYCPECNEDLEADDDIKGSKMKCPACWKEIDVPEVGVKVERKRRAESGYRVRDPRAGDHGFAGMTAKFVGVVLLISVLVLGTMLGIGVYLREQQSVDDRPDCGICHATGKLRCSKCRGAKRENCKNCEGKGNLINFRGEQEKCTPCSGSGTVPCPYCGGGGEYDCQECGGEGKVGEKPESYRPMPSMLPSPPLPFFI